jgi:NADH-quinone oxidoreductase subunit G
MRFLDCVDRRDSDGAVNLLHPAARWSTASPFGDIDGALAIGTFIKTRLPARTYGPAFERHRMESAADIEDLTVVTPRGERCRFTVVLDTLHDGNQPKMLIRSLVRAIL